MDRQVSDLDLRIRLADCAPMRIGLAMIDPVAHEARYGETIERLQPQVLKVLIALARRAGNVVTRSELLDRCWEGRFVGEDVVNRAVRLARGLADRAGGFTIETVPKSGYRLKEQEPASHAIGGRAAAILAATLVAALTLAVLVVPRSPAKPEPPSVALLPFTSSADQEGKDLAAAGADTVSHMLLDSGHSVRLSWPANANDLRTADLNIAGDVRRTGAGFTALVQLRDRRSGIVLFSRRYESNAAEAARLPARMGAEMATNLSGALAMMVLDRRRPLQPALAADILKQISIGYFDEDIVAAYGIAGKVAASAPQSAIAQLALAFDSGFVLDQLPLDQRSDAVRAGRVAAGRAVALAPDFGDSYLPWCLLHPSVRLGECENRMREGIKADRDAPFVSLFLSGMLSRAGRNREALQLARLALASDRYNPNKIAQLERTLIEQGLVDEADRLFAQGERYWPSHAGLHWARIDGFMLRGDLDGVERAVAALPTDVPVIDRKAVAPLFRARHARDFGSLRTLCLAKDANADVQRLCLVALREANDRDAAFSLSDRLFATLVAATPDEEEQHWLANPSSGIDKMIGAPAMAWLRDDPRYERLVERVGLMRYWRRDRAPDFCAEEISPICARIRSR